MIRESVAYLVDAVDDFLAERNVVLQNDEKKEDPNAAIIYGTDYDNLFQKMVTSLEGSNVHISDTFNETGISDEGHGENLVIFVPSAGKIIKIYEGTGDNLLKEDRAEGYIDYINYDIYDPQNIGEENEEDGGMVLCKEYVKDKYPSLIDAVHDVFDMAWGTYDLSYIVLSRPSN